METTPTTTTKVQKVKYLKLTDQIGKKHCSHFVEVNVAPKSGIPESLLRNTLIVITWEDGSTGEYALEDLLRCSLHNLPSLATWQSHGMPAFEFVKMMYEQHPGISADAEMGVYFYRKL